MSNYVCIYHANCLDGFGAAWCVWRALGDLCEYIPFRYGIDLDLEVIKDRHVYIVDFSFAPLTMSNIIRHCKSLTWIDHHKTAQRHIEHVQDFADLNFPEKSVDIVFDLDKSGALLTWEYIEDYTAPHPPPYNPVPAPFVIQAISDRDLWRFKLEGTKEICAALYMQPFEFELWNDLIRNGIDALWEQGSILLKKQADDVEKIAKATAFVTDFQGFQVPVACAPFTVASDLGHLLTKGYPFSITWYVTNQGKRKVSLRSSDKGEDVAKIAETYGGGGHRNAAGFEVSLITFPKLRDWRCSE